jgi:hypothetical protein
VTAARGTNSHPWPGRSFIPATLVVRGISATSAERRQRVYDPRLPSVSELAVSARRLDTTTAARPANSRTLAHFRATLRIFLAAPRVVRDRCDQFNSCIAYEPQVDRKRPEHSDATGPDHDLGRARALDPHDRYDPDSRHPSARENPGPALSRLRVHSYRKADRRGLLRPSRPETATCERRRPLPREPRGPWSLARARAEGRPPGLPCWESSRRCSGSSPQARPGLRTG